MHPTRPQGIEAGRGLGAAPMVSSARASRAHGGDEGRGFLDAGQALAGSDGDAPLDIDIRFAVPLERMGAVSPGYTAHRAVNAVPFVCAAPPGIRSIVDLPQIVAMLDERAG